MNKDRFWKVTTLALTIALGASIAYRNIPRAEAEEQPHMRAALSQLDAAKSSLEKASADKGGHRVAAIKYTKMAMEETQKGIDFDNKR